MPVSSQWTVDIPEISLPSLLFTSPAHSLPDKPFFLDASSPSTKYLTLDSYRLWSQRLAAGLRESGLQDGDRVLLFSGNSIFFPVAFMGVIMAGGIFTGANHTFVARELAFQLKDSDPLFLLCAKTCLDTGCEAASQVGLPKNQIFVFDDAPTSENTEYSFHGCRHWSSLFMSEVEGRAFRWNELSLPNECHQTMALNYSSGTTGLPKGVEITHYNYVANTLQMEHLENLSKDSVLCKGLDRWLCFLPMYHAMAQTVFISLAVWRGIPVFVMPQYSYVKMLDCIQDFGITRLVLVPPVLVTMAKDPRIKRGDWDLSSITQISCGAAPLSREIIEEIETHWVGNHARVDGSGKVRVTQGYGMTELTCGVIMAPRGASIPSPKTQPLQFAKPSADEHFLMDVSFSADPMPVGELLANCSAKIMNEDGSAEVPPGARGELWIRGPTVMKGYWRNESATKATVTEDGWLITGDICTVDENHYFSIVDRKKELIKVRAHQVAPAELEALLLTHPSILDAAVIATLIAGEPHPRAYIVPRPDCALRDDGGENVMAFVRQRAARVKWITGGVRCVKAIPRNPAGKVLRRVLREMEMAERERGTGAGKL